VATTRSTQQPAIARLGRDAGGAGHGRCASHVPVCL